MDRPLAAVVCWAELLSANPRRSAGFYGGLFGWTFEEMPGPDSCGVLCSHHGAAVACIATPPAQLAGASAWLSFVAVDDIERCLDQVGVQGGTVVAPVRSAVGRGTTAMVSDPSGAVFGLRQPPPPRGQPAQTTGSMAWNELHSTDLPVALQFYARVFGWQWDEVPGSDGYMVGHCLSAPEGVFTTWGATGFTSGDPVGANPSSASLGTRSGWTVYFAVADCGAACALALELGGSVFLAPVQMGPGIYAGIRDPNGSTFMVGHLTPQQ